MNTVGERFHHDSDSITTMLGLHIKTKIHAGSYLQASIARISMLLKIQRLSPLHIVQTSLTFKVFEAI